MDKEVSIAHIPRMWRSRCGQYRVRISRRCLPKMLSIARAHTPVEAGTSLVGQYSGDQHTAYVLDLAPLTEDSDGRRRSFTRGVRGLKEFFGKLFSRFRGRRHYVGEWHSHPGGSCSASDIDDANQSDIAADGKTECPECILLILSGDVAFAESADLGVYVYSHTRGRVELVPCAPQ